jgi:hypothetical protein
VNSTVVVNTGKRIENNKYNSDLIVDGAMFEA